MIHHSHHGNRTARLLIKAAIFLLFAGAALPAVAQTITPETFSRLMYRYIGPSRKPDRGRASASPAIR